MKKHVRIALNARKLKGCEDWLCEICGRSGIVNGMDVHHVVAKGMGGRAGADAEENLIIICRHCHNACHRSEYKAEALLYHVKQILKIFK